MTAPWLRVMQQPPQWWRRLCPHAVFRLPAEGREVYLTFDDGPVPEVTPWVLDQLERAGARATFFMVADNARRYPEVRAMVERAGHTVGNHTMHHLQGLRTDTRAYLDDVAEASRWVDSRLFRPPHGLMRPAQAKALAERYKIVMHDVLTRDYSPRQTARGVVEAVQTLTRPGSVIVFHDSAKAWPRLREALPQALDWLRGEGYTFRTL